MKTSYNWLKDYLKGKAPAPEKLAEILTFHSFEVENVHPVKSAKGGAKQFDRVKKVKGDWLLDIDVLPNRAHDCFSHLGVAREVAALTGCKFVEPKIKIKEDKNIKAKDLVGVEVENKTDCPRYTAKVMIDVKVGDSPKWLRERLVACGLQSINNIVDAANYVMLETGQPIHAFDFDKIKSMEIPNPKSQILNKSQISNSKFQTKTILIRRAKKGEKVAALDGKEYQLDKDILVIADGDKPIAIAGIKGGVETGIDKQTENIIIEAANFEPVLTRKASQKLKLKTDASMRFEQGIDPNLIDYAQERVCSLIEQVAGGKTAQGMVDCYPKPPALKIIILDLAYVGNLLGIAIGKEEIRRILESLGFQCLGSGLASFKVVAPSRRLDVAVQEDLIEEVGRIYGYDRILSKAPKADLAIPERNEELFWQDNAVNTLKELGFNETYNYSFIGEKEKQVFAWQDRGLVEVENPISSFNKYLRPSLIMNLLKVARENFKNFDKVKLFEIGRVFFRRQEAGGPSSSELRRVSRRQAIREKNMLSGILIRKGVKDDGFFELKGAVEHLLQGLGVSDVWYDSVEATPEDSPSTVWHPGKTAEIKVGDKEIGFLGEIHPQIKADFNIKARAFVFDINFDELLKLVSEEQGYQPISAYPSSVRDLAVLTPQGVKVVDVLNIINSAGGKLVRDVDLFDIYSGANVPDGKENLAFHIIYQSEDKTLSSQDVDMAHQKIVKALEQQPNWEVRK